MGLKDILKRAKRRYSAKKEEQAAPEQSPEAHIIPVQQAETPIFEPEEEISSDEWKKRLETANMTQKELEEGLETVGMTQEQLAEGMKQLREAAISAGNALRQFVGRDPVELAKRAKY